MDLKSGWKTTEFWLSVLAFIVAVFVNSGVVPDVHWSMKLAGALLGGLSILGYSIGRGVAKSGVRSLLPFLLVLGAASLLTLGASGCQTTARGAIAKGLALLPTIDSFAVPEMQKSCEPKVKACPSWPPERCEAYVTCAKQLDTYRASMDTVGRELQSLNKLLLDLGVK